MGKRKPDTEIRRPNIGVTGPDHGGESAWWFTRFAIWLQGGKAVRITPANRKILDEIALDGLILGGGADIDPERYGAKQLKDKFRDKPKLTGFRQWVHTILSALLLPLLLLSRKIFSVRRSKSLDTARNRDDLEFTLLKEALKQQIPVLGICRGSQLINVQFGGSLHQDISSFYSEIPQLHTVWPEKTVEIEPDSRLFQIVKTPEARVNALHNQAVEKLGNTLNVVAKEESGVVQAIEHPEYPFLIGVQWHPEYMPQLPYQRNIFKELVDTAKKSRHQVKAGDDTLIPETREN